jgi:hypothetical protein
VEVNMGFEGMYELHLEDWRVGQSWNQKDAGRKLRLFLSPPPSFLRWSGTEVTTGLLWSNWRNVWQGKLKYSEKTCISAYLSTTNPTWPDLGCHVMKPVTNYLSLCCMLVSYLVYSSVLKMEAEPLLDANFMMLSCLAFSTLRMEVLCSSEMSVDFQRIMLCYIPGDRFLHFARKFSYSSN